MLKLGVEKMPDHLNSKISGLLFSWMIKWSDGSVSGFHYLFSLPACPSLAGFTE